MPERYIDPKSILEAGITNQPEAVFVADVNALDIATLARLHSLFTTSGIEFKVGAKAPKSVDVASALKENNCEVEIRGTVLIIKLPGVKDQKAITFQGKVGEFMGAFLRFEKIKSKSKQ